MCSRGGNRGSGRLGTGFRGGLGRGFLSSGRLRRGPRAIDFSSKLLDLASQRGKGQVKGGAEELKLVLGRGRGRRGDRGGVFIEREDMQDGDIAKHHLWSTKVCSSQ